MSAVAVSLRDIRGVLRIARAASTGVTGNAPRIERAEQQATDVEVLIACDREYNDALAELKKHYLTVASHGYIEAKIDDARAIAQRFVVAGMRRDAALAMLGNGL